MGHGIVLGNHPRDGIDGFKKKQNNFHISPLNFYFVVFLMSLSIF